MKGKKVFIILGCCLLVALLAWEIAGYAMISRDAKKVAEDVNAGRAVWSDYYQLDLSETILKQLVEEENPGIVTYIMNSAQIETKVAPMLFNSSKVTFYISSINYIDFVKYCESIGITDYEQMLVEFENYKEFGTRTEYEVAVKWKWHITKCEKNLQTTEFIDAATGGFMTYYSELIHAAEEDLESLLGGEDSEAEN